MDTPSLKITLTDQATYFDAEKEAMDIAYRWFGDRTPWDFVHFDTRLNAKGLFDCDIEVRSHFLCFDPVVPHILESGWIAYYAKVGNKWKEIEGKRWACVEIDGQEFYQASDLVFYIRKQAEEKDKTFPRYRRNVK